MIYPVFKYAYPNAKIRAMKGTLVSAEKFLALLNAVSYQEFLRILESTGYAAALRKYTGELPIPVLTNILYKSLFTDYEKTIHALTGETQKFFILLYQKYELINLKTILRGICSNVEPEQVAPLLLPTERYALFSKERLLTFRRVQEVVTHLRHTFFEYPLQQALRRYEEEQEFFPLEMALDLHYYQALWDEIRKLSHDEGAIIRKLIGMATDVINVSWIVRFKEQYHFSPEEILNYTIHHGDTLKFRDRRMLANAPGASDILAYLQKTRCGKGIAEGAALSTLHVTLTRQVVAQLRKYFGGYPFQIGVILGYLFLKEFEIADLMTVAEAKKYGFSLEQSTEYVIHRTRDD